MCSVATVRCETAVFGSVSNRFEIGFSNKNKRKFNLNFLTNQNSELKKKIKKNEKI